MKDPVSANPTEAERVLREFLHYPLNDGLQILQRFAKLEGAVVGEGDGPMERFVYVPGSRKHPVLLVAHVDTVWDQHYQQEQKGMPPTYGEELITSNDPAAGIGADDRAGCALLWLLKDSGHSLLLLDGEEKGHYAAKYLQEKRKSFLRKLNRHAYILALDLPGERYCHYHNVPNCRKFSRFFEENFDCIPMPRNFGSDLSYLCKGACGANLSIGVYRMHRPEETLNLSQWLHTYDKLCSGLLGEQAMFRTRKLIRSFRFVEKKLKCLWAWILKLRKAR